MIVVELFASRYFTGPAERILESMRGLAERKHAVAFGFTAEPPGVKTGKVAPGTLADQVPTGVRALDGIQLDRKGLVLPGLAGDARRLAREFEGSQTVIVHAHTSHDHWTARLWKVFARNRVVLVRTVHETRQAARRRGDVPLFAACDGVIAISEAMKRTLVSSYRLDPDRVAVIPGSVDPRVFKPDVDASEIRRELGAADGRPIAGIVSRIKPGRGHDWLLESFRDALAAVPDARLAIVGRGEGKAALEQAVHEAALDDAVRFLGYRRDDLANVYNAFTVSVLLGEGSDGTCRAALEAMACGKPVLAARVGSLPETIEDGVTGRLLAPGDRAGLAVALIEYLTNPGFATEQGAQARAAVLARFTHEAMVDRHEAFFRRLTGEA